MRPREGPAIVIFSSKGNGQLDRLFSRILALIERELFILLETSKLEFA